MLFAYRNALVVLSVHFRKNVILEVHLRKSGEFFFCFCRVPAVTDPGYQDSATHFWDCFIRKFGVPNVQPRDQPEYNVKSTLF